MADSLYHYLKAEGLTVFFAPAPECQAFLSGRSQREAFYSVFGMQSEYCVLLVSESYLARRVPMEEAGIAFAKRGPEGKVIPVYTDGSVLPPALLDPQKTNYFRSNHPALIASHVAAKINAAAGASPKGRAEGGGGSTGNTMNICCNKAKKQIFINKLKVGK